MHLGLIGRLPAASRRDAIFEMPRLYSISLRQIIAAYGISHFRRVVGAILSALFSQAHDDIFVMSISRTLAPSQAAATPLLMTAASRSSYER